MNFSSFVNANLSGVDFTDASLRDVDLSGADLTEADLSGADLSGANLSDIIWRRTTGPDGSFSFDNTPETCFPSVVYDFSGFISPIDNLPTVNAAKAGKAIPVKFSLNGDQGLDILAAGYPASQEVACDSNAAVDEVEETSTAGNSGLSYDPGSDQYSYTWKTDKGWSGACRQLIVRFNDGSEYTALFQFK